MQVPFGVPYSDTASGRGCRRGSVSRLEGTSTTRQILGVSRRRGQNPEELEDLQVDVLARVGLEVDKELVQLGRGLVQVGHGLVGVLVELLVCAELAERALAAV